jgi:cyclic-di-AMP phosphodiesterase PgpH
MSEFTAYFSEVRYKFERHDEGESRFSYSKQAVTSQADRILYAHMNVFQRLTLWMEQHQSHRREQRHHRDHHRDQHRDQHRADHRATGIQPSWLDRYWTQVYGWIQQAQDPSQPHAFNLAQQIRQVLSPKVFRRKTQTSDRHLSILLLLVAILCITSAIGYRFYNEPQLAVNTIAPQTLKAPAPAQVTDEAATELMRQQARTKAIPALEIDAAATQAIAKNLERLLSQGDAWRKQAGAFPFVQPSVLSTVTQRYWVQVSESEWQAAIARVESIPHGSKADTQPPTPAKIAANTTDASSQELAVLELQAYRRTYAADDFALLKSKIVRSRQSYSRVAKQLQPATSPYETTPFYDVSLLALSDEEWGQTKAIVQQSLKRMLAQGISPGLPTPHLENAVKLQLEGSAPPPLIPLSQRLMLQVIQPNLIHDELLTKLRAERAAQEVADVTVSINKGQTITERGDRITSANFAVLDHFGMSRRGVNWWGLSAFAALVSAAIALLLWIERRFHSGLRRQDYLLILLLVLSTPLLLLSHLPATNLLAIALLIGSFYGSAVGGTTMVLLSILLPMGMVSGQPSLWISAGVGGVTGAIVAGRLRSREELAKWGGAIALLQGMVYLIVHLVLSPPTPVFGLLTLAGLQTLMGIAWSIVALGVSPYLEQGFDLITPVRLAELSSPNRPLLMQLAAKTPGTFQHTLLVATLAEAAARALGDCNVELVRAGALYHDIGKMHDPLGFIENQMGGTNKHDEIDDPWVSLDIIKKHVSEGLVMARRHRLPQAIQAFIPEHQGTMQIAYFYHAAMKRSQADHTIQVNEAEFRYAGPIPQSRETGIVMLADSCEAALRSLKDTSTEDALQMLNRILRARWQDNQLIDCGLRREEMPKIAETFVTVWLQFHHKRIAYPKPLG